jgi:AraC-like DNA-binding protein
MSLCLNTGPGPSAAAGAAAARPPSAHVRCAPSPALARFVDHYWATRWDRRGQPPRDAAALLDPCVHLQLGSPGGGAPSGDVRAVILGVVRGTYRVRVEEVGRVVGAKFRPGGFYPFVRQPVARWTDRVVPLAAVFAGAAGSVDAWARAVGEPAGAWARGGAGAAGDATPDGAPAAALAAHLDAFLGARLPARDPVAEDVADLVARVAADPAVRRVGDLARAGGWSERTLHRVFARYVGVSPAWLIRRRRLREAAERLTQRPPADARAVAWELGYADQAHLIRDFRRAVGVTPGAYVRAPGGVASVQAGGRPKV